ncbi:MAG: hypothetical protein IK116_08745 [Firmicutes bacterium]|nr:hypothetical protein [Bacillota bacterium]
MTRYVKCFRDFSGGLAEAAGDDMADNQLQQARNAVPLHHAGLRRTGLRRADGTEQAFPPLPGLPGQRAYAMLELTLADGSEQLLAFSEYDVRRENLYRYDAGTESWTALLSDQRPHLDHFIRAHRLYWLTGLSIRVYDGESVGYAAPTPAGDSLTAAEAAVWNKVVRAVAVAQRGRRWFYATPDNEVIFSEVGDPFRFDPTNIINVEPGGNDRVTALREFCGGLLIFLSDSVYFLSGWDLEDGSDLTLSRLNVTSGTVWPRTVQAAENAVFYLGRDGVYRLRLPAGGAVLAADNISDGRLSRGLLEEGRLFGAFAAVWNNIYHISLLSGAGPPREYRYYPRLDAFFGPYDHGARSYSRLSGNRLLLGLEGGRLACFDPESRRYLLEDGSYGPIRFEVTTKGFDVAGALARNVKIKSVLLAARQYKEEGSHAAVRIKTDYTDGAGRLELISWDESLVYGEGSYGEAIWGWKDTVTKELPVNRLAQRLTLYFSDSSAGEPLVLYGAAVLYKARKVRAERGGVRRLTVDHED